MRRNSFSEANGKVKLEGAKRKKKIKENGKDSTKGRVFLEFKALSHLNRRKEKIHRKRKSSIYYFLIFSIFEIKKL